MKKNGGKKKWGQKKLGKKIKKLKKSGVEKSKQAVVEVASEVLFGLVQNGALVWPRSKLTLEIQLFASELLFSLVVN